MNIDKYSPRRGEVELTTEIAYSVSLVVFWRSPRRLLFLMLFSIIFYGVANKDDDDDDEDYDDDDDDDDDELKNNVNKAAWTPYMIDVI